ncbi:molybdopterin-dependent oxidoreductase [Pseudactinotalea sp. HY158]|uniref:molybdopterin-dependent oxidoreductase n=1 Tax=Pseudactinotalea sp. HY158 TaxID=2654547 RepID=UPI00129CD76F|nr:molybdopterin-dependent oxidoreductase [Pseudactinotalea sp. HY158]QGH68758.1 molybdopterin-dependent oxidoreductase [Pseudactinotalea sp. HY158]
MSDFFPWWVVVTHALNVMWMLLLFRSGIEVLSAFPKLHWRDDCPPGRQWLRLSRKQFGADSRRPWTSLDEEESWSPVLALPGRKNLGLGRHWHFMTIQFWILTGLVYIVAVFATGYWRYLVPVHWSIVPDSINAIGSYLQFELPATIPGEPFEPAQKLAYFVVVFLMAPLQIATGAAMSPSVLARFPRYGRIFGGKQGARSLHFLLMCAFAAFIVVHVTMVVIHGLPKELAAIVLGDPGGDRRLATGIGAAVLLAIIVLQVVVTWYSLRHRRRTQRLLGLMVDPFERAISRRFTSNQHYPHTAISPYFRVNGYPPAGAEYERMAADGFRDFRLTVGGLVAHPAAYALADLRELGSQRQITKHNCIQGWTAVAEWAGVPLADVIAQVEPDPRATRVVFYAMDDKGLTEGEGRYGYFYGTIPIHLAENPQTILALEMNGAPLPVEHGAPIRLRVETQLGFKMVKWIRAIEFVDDVSEIGMGMGGWREDQQFYANAAGI